MSTKYICSPLNYIGGKYKLLPQLLPLFPKDVNTFVDLFCGGCNVGINAIAHKVIFNDCITHLVDMYKMFQTLSIESLLLHIDTQIKRFDLSINNNDGYNKLRNLYNTERNPLDLFILCVYSFNHQIRFNTKGEFNMPFGRDKSYFNDSIRINLINFKDKLSKCDCTFSSLPFNTVDLSNLTTSDFVYCDPPYLITTATYNAGWSEREEVNLLNILSSLNDRNIRFGLSNVLSHKGKTNTVLDSWVKDNGFIVTHLEYDYNNSNYHAKNTDKSTDEVFITNYKVSVPIQLSLF